VPSLLLCDKGPFIHNPHRGKARKRLLSSQKEYITPLLSLCRRDEVAHFVVEHDQARGVGGYQAAAAGMKH
jgi:hypothetical protein